MNSSIREILKDKKRIVIKIGSSSLTHPETGALNLTKLEVLVREISDLHNMGKDVIVVSSGAIAVGRRAAGLGHRPSETKEKQACACLLYTSWIWTALWICRRRDVLPHG